MAPRCILFVTSDGKAVEPVRSLAAQMGAELSLARSFEDAAKTIVRQHFDAMLVQVDAPGGLIRRRLAEGLVFRKDPPVIALGGTGSIRDAVCAVRAGACDYLPAPPADGGALARALRQVLSHESAEGLSTPAVAPLEGFIAADCRMAAVCETVARISDSEVTLLVEGESGTGKSLLAEKLHEHSPRHLGPFLEVNCAALTDPQMERELFGDNGDAPDTDGGACPGAFELADGGTILLSQVAHVGPFLQTKLVRVIESGEFQPRSTDHTLKSDVRVVVAVSPSLTQWLGQGPFQEVLRRRVSTVTVQLPPLRERVADVPLLARHFLRAFAAKHGRPVREFRPGALDRLLRYPWPGNVRELRNAVEHAVLLARDGAIGSEDLPEPVARTHVAAPRTSPRLDYLPLKSALREPERLHILRALRLSKWNKQHTARKLKISRSTLYKKIREYGLTKETEEAGQRAVTGAEAGNWATGVP